jgi:hypothetical protein
VGRTIWLIIRFIGKYEPRPYLVTEEAKEQIALVTLATTKDKSKDSEEPTQYAIRHEPTSSPYKDSLINYDTTLLVSKNDLAKIIQLDYYGRQVSSPYHKLNDLDLKLFQQKQGNYFQNPKYQKRLVRIIFGFSTSE